jgi:hypothetical protein
MVETCFSNSDFGRADAGGTRTPTEAEGLPEDAPTGSDARGEVVTTLTATGRADEGGTPTETESVSKNASTVVWALPIDAVTGVARAKDIAAGSYADTRGEEVSTPTEGINAVISPTREKEQVEDAGDISSTNEIPQQLESANVHIGVGPKAIGSPDIAPRAECPAAAASRSIEAI